MVDNTTFKPSLVAMESLELMQDYPWVETELAKFNLETNIEPKPLKEIVFLPLKKKNSF